MKRPWDSKDANTFDFPILANALTAMLFGIVAFCVLIVANQAIGLFKAQGLIFDPGTSVHYQTSEFDFTANINSQGFRGGLDNFGSYSILCIGDSFTFGWGVSGDDSWPARLQSYLHANGFPNIKVINCGQPGTTTTQYKEILRRALPVLKPDLVLIGVLQGDDLADIYQSKFVGKPLPGFVQFCFGHILKLFRPRVSELNWKSQAKSILSKMNTLERIHFSTLDDSVQSMFLSGNLNPALVSLYVDFPNRYQVFNDPHNSATQYAAKRMAQDFREMKETFPKIVFVNLPVVYYRWDETQHGVDSLYRSIAERNQLPYIQVALSHQNYFQYDGHPTARGYEEIAEQIGSELISTGIIR